MQQGTYIYIYRVGFVQQGTQIYGAAGNLDIKCRVCAAGNLDIQSRVCAAGNLYIYTE